MVRAGDNNELIPKWLTQKVASIGWEELGDPKRFSSREKLIEKAHSVYADEKPGTRHSWAGQVWRFSNEIGVNDRIITYSKETREYIIGTVTKAHQYRPDMVDSYYPNVISVAWEPKRVSRDQLTQGAKNSLGGILTVFRVDDWGTELLGLLAGEAVSKPTLIDEQDEQTEEIHHQNFVEQAKAMIEDLVDRLDPWKMQDLVAGLLEAMDYQVKVSPKGPDGGVDILAHRDAFGFEQPIIKVQVKHRHAASGGPEIQQLIGANPHGASCLFVSTGGFTSAAKSSAQHNGVKLLDLSGIVELLNEWYEKMPVDKQALIPLKRIYVPM